MAEKEVVQGIGLLRSNWQLISGAFMGLFGVLGWFGALSGKVKRIDNKVRRIQAVTLDDDWNSKVVAINACRDCKEDSEKTQEKILEQIEKSNRLQQDTATNLATLTGSFNQFVEDQKS